MAGCVTFFEKYGGFPHSLVLFYEKKGHRILTISEPLLLPIVCDSER